MKFSAYVLLALATSIWFLLTSGFEPGYIGPQITGTLAPVSRSRRFVPAEKIIPFNFIFQVKVVSSFEFRVSSQGPTLIRFDIVSGVLEK